MNRPTLRQLTIFLEVYRRKSVSVAAERLHMTQAATSIALRQLEAQLGGLLFNRTTRRLTSTPLADQLAPLAELSLASAGVTNTIAPQQIVHLSGIRGLESSVLHGPRVKRHVSAILSCHHPLEHWPRQVLEHCIAYYEGLTQKTDGTGTGSTP